MKEIETTNSSKLILLEEIKYYVMYNLEIFNVTVTNRRKPSPACISRSTYKYWKLDKCITW